MSVVMVASIECLCYDWSVISNIFIMSEKLRCTVECLFNMSLGDLCMKFRKATQLRREADGRDRDSVGVTFDHVVLKGINDTISVDTYVSEDPDGGKIVSGGFTKGTGFLIDWQDGPLKDRGEQSGAFVEDVMLACIERLQSFQSTKFRCRENACAITHLQEAHMWLRERMRDRQERGVEGKMEV